MLSTVKIQNKCIETVKEMASTQKSNICPNVTKILHIVYKFIGQTLFALSTLSHFY